ncbi:MAG TPA: porin family protein [Bacteroidales bacterium]|nr:porin family protein [Bacteroidales bacterium]
MKTKKLSFLIIMAFCSIISSNAQSATRFIGIKTGFGIPNLTAGSVVTPLSEGYSSRIGYYGGIVAEMQTGKRFGIRCEVNYSSQGGKRYGLQALPVPSELQYLWQILPLFSVTPDEYMYADIKSYAILNYLEVPVMVKASFNLAGNIHFYINAGPYLGILVSAKNVTKGSDYIYINKEGTITIDDVFQQAQIPYTVGVQNFDHTENISSDVHRLNVGGEGAMGFDIAMGSGKLFIEGGGNYGFIHIQKDKANGTNNTGAGTVTLGYLHRF